MVQFSEGLSGHPHVIRRRATETRRDSHAAVDKDASNLVAGAALVAAGAFATALGEETTNGGSAPIVSVSSGQMTLGGTATTTTTPPAAAPIAIAKPAQKATVPCGFTKGC
jgi:hypothetical protein